MTAKGLISYAQLAFPLAFAGLPLYIQVPDFYAVSYGLSLTFLGAALFIIRLTDAFLDPSIGNWSDRAGRHRPAIMSIAGGLFALAFLMLFRPPLAAEGLWFVVSVALATLSFSVLVINLNAIASLMPSDPTLAASWREGFGLIGLISAILLPYAVSSMTDYADTVAAITVLSCGLFVCWLKKQDFISSQTKPAARFGFRHALKPPFSRFFTVYALSILASSLPAVLVVFYIRDWLDAENMTGLFLGLYFISALAAIPVWRLVARKTGNQHAWLMAMILASMAIFAALFTTQHSIILYSIICIVSGAALGAELFIPPAILTHLIQARGENANASGYFGIYAFFMKFALAAAAGFSLIALDIGGFKPGSDSGCCGLATLVFLYAALPAAVKLCAVFLLVKYGEITDEKNTVNPYHGSPRHHVA